MVFSAKKQNKLLSFDFISRRAQHPLFSNPVPVGWFSPRVFDVRVDPHLFLGWRHVCFLILGPCQDSFTLPVGSQRLLLGSGARRARSLASSSCSFPCFGACFPSLNWLWNSVLHSAECRSDVFLLFCPRRTHRTRPPLHNRLGFSTGRMTSSCPHPKGSSSYFPLY